MYLDWANASDDTLPIFFSNTVPINHCYFQLKLIVKKHTGMYKQICGVAPGI